MTIFKTLFLIAIFSMSSIVIANTTVCPLGKKEDHLTIQRVMINFGKYTMTADTIALKDVTPEQDVTDTQLIKAIGDLKLAQACADAVIENPTGDLLPATTGPQDSPARDKLIRHLVMYMTEFSDALVDYRLAIEDVLATPAASRNFHEVYLHYKNVDNLVTRAHRETSFDMDENKSFTGLDKENSDIKNPMEHAGELFTKIKKTVTNANNNAANALAARQMATFFTQVINYVPETILRLPDNQRSIAMADFQKMIQQEVDLSIQLALAFEKNDNTAAIKIVQQMNSLKMEGHDRYDP